MATSSYWLGPSCVCMGLQLRQPALDLVSPVAHLLRPPLHLQKQGALLSWHTMSICQILRYAHVLSGVAYETMMDPAR